MNPQKKPVKKLIMIFTAVAIFQCCCCIIPYTWNAGFDNFSFAAPFQTQEENSVPYKDSMKAEQTEGDVQTNVAEDKDCEEDLNGSQALAMADALFEEFAAGR